MHRNKKKQTMDISQQTRRAIRTFSDRHYQDSNTNPHAQYTHTPTNLTPHLTEHPISSGLLSKSVISSHTSKYKESYSYSLWIQFTDFHSCSIYRPPHFNNAFANYTVRAHLTAMTLNWFIMIIHFHERIFVILKITILLTLARVLYVCCTIRQIQVRYVKTHLF